MIQAMRSRHTGLAGSLPALWFVPFFACSFTHVQAPASGIMDEGSTSLGPVPSNHAQHDQGAADRCSALQNAPLTQQLLTLLALTALFGLSADLPRRFSTLQPVPLFGPGLSTPIRKQLHRYNE